jgi:uncharacterized protein
MQIINNTYFDQFVIKIASRCNLACEYCYEYFHGDDSWRRQPRFMAIETIKKVAQRIADHAKNHQLNHVSISLHGGEPMLAGLERLSEYVKIFQKEIKNTNLGIGIQSNGTLYNLKIHEWAMNTGVTIGISIDGPPPINDKRRFYANGKGSSEKIEQTLLILKNTPVFSGILSVIDVSCDPINALNYLSSWQPPILDFLLPHGNWQNYPPSKSKIDGEIVYGHWLARVFDEWWSSSNLSRIRIRTFEEIILRLLNLPGTLETLGVEPVTLLTIATDGSYEGVDTLKSAFPGAQVLNMNVKDNSLDDALNHKSVIMRQLGIKSLSHQCQKCEIVHVCGGGYLPHRFGEDGTFLHPSIYCEDLLYLINHISSTLHQYVIKKNEH